MLKSRRYNLHRFWISFVFLPILRKKKPHTSHIFQKTKILQIDWFPMEVFSGRKKKSLRFKTQAHIHRPGATNFSFWCHCLPVWFRFFPPLNFVHVCSWKKHLSKFDIQVMWCKCSFEKNDGLFFTGKCWGGGSSEMFNDLIGIMIWKLCSSNWIICVKGVKIKNVRNHHLGINIVTIMKVLFLYQKKKVPPFRPAHLFTNPRAPIDTPSPQRSSTTT